MSEADIFNELQLIRQRIERIEHTQEILVRADSERILQDVFTEMDADPTLAHVYLLVDGERGQGEIVAEMDAQGLPGASQPTVSRRLGKLQFLHLVEPIDRRGGVTIYLKTGVDRILRLSERVRRRLDAR